MKVPFFQSYNFDTLIFHNYLQNVNIKVKDSTIFRISSVNSEQVL